MKARLELEHLVSVRPVGPGNWSPDGSLIAFVQANRAGINYLWVCDASGRYLRQACNTPVVLEMNEGTDRRDVWGGPQWSADGSRIAFTSKSTWAPQQNSVWITQIDGSPAKELTHHSGSDITPRWSPDGSRIAFVCHRNGRDDIQVTPADGSVSMQLTYDRWDNTDLNWSPDGRWLVYISQRSDIDLFSNHLCIVPADGGTLRQLTHGDRFNDRSPRWSPDGRRIVFVSNRNDDDDIWMIDADGSNLHVLTSGRGDKGDPRWSPNGQWIVYTHFHCGGFDLCLVPADGGASSVIASGGCSTAPRWSPDGKRILYQKSGPDSPADLWRIDVDESVAHSPCQLTRCSGESLCDIEFSHPKCVTYRSSDNLEIEALLYSRVRGNSGPGPAIVYVHGGPNSLHADTWHPLLQYLCMRGYTILAANYRGSTGYGKAFMEANIGEKAGGDLFDWIQAAEFLRLLPEVDASRVAIMGRSAGGYAALLALGQAPDVFQAGVAISAPSDWFTYWEETEIAWTRRFRMKLMGLPSAHQELYARRAPITYAAGFKSPVLILHGAMDPGVPSGQAREMAAELARLGKEHRCIVYSGEGHQPTGAAAITDATQQIERFLAESLRDAGPSSKGPSISPHAPPAQEPT